jgi:hypothetical protein
LKVSIRPPEGGLFKLLIKEGNRLMENLHATPPRELPGDRILRLMTIAPNSLQEDGEQRDVNRMNKDKLMEQFVFGNGLADVDTLIIDGHNALEQLPRPDAFGNNRLALMAILDSMAHGSMMTLESDEENLQTIAAD